jgi:hypothetical protein
LCAPNRRRAVSQSSAVLVASRERIWATWKLEPSDYHGPMLRLLLKGVPIRRFASGSSVVGAVLAAEIAAMAWTHLAMLNGVQRRRLLALLGRARGRPGSLSDSEREELRALVAILQPRLFLGAATSRLSPLPVPKRVLYGPRGSSARGAAQRRSDRGRPALP